MFRRPLRDLAIAPAAILIVAGVAYASGAASAATGVIYSCVDKQGGIQIVGPTATCRPKESPLAWNAQGQPGGGGQLVVVDANQQLVGPLVDPQHVAVLAGTTWTDVSVTPLGVTQFDEIDLWYQSSNCTGQPFVVANSILSYGQVMGSTLYYSGGPVASMHFGSVQANVPPGLTQANCNAQSTDLIAGPLATFTLPEFVAPLAVVAR